MNKKRAIIINNEYGQRRRSVVLAAATAGLIIFMWGIAYRVMAARLEAPVDTNPIQSEVLEKFPLQVSDWTGEDVPLDDAIVRATDTDAHLNRRYLRGNASEYVMLYIACGIKARDLMPHRPEVCYTGAGWTLIDKCSLELPLTDEIKLPCNILQFSRGSLSKEKVIVLDYYIVDGRYCNDVSLLRSKAWRGSGTIRYVAQVQIITSVLETLGTDSSQKIISDFAIESALPIAGLFESNEENQQSDMEKSEVSRMSGEAENG